MAAFGNDWMNYLNQGFIQQASKSLLTPSYRTGMGKNTDQTDQQNAQIGANAPQEQNFTRNWVSGQGGGNWQRGPMMADQAFGGGGIVRPPASTSPGTWARGATTGANLLGKEAGKELGTRGYEALRELFTMRSPHIAGSAVDITGVGAGEEGLHGLADLVGGGAEGIGEIAPNLIEPATTSWMNLLTPSPASLGKAGVETGMNIAGVSDPYTRLGTKIATDAALTALNPIAGGTAIAADLLQYLMRLF